MNRELKIAVGLLMLAAVLMAGTVAFSQNDAQVERLAREFDNRPVECATIVLGILEPAQKVALRNALFPPPTNEQKRERLAEARAKLIDSGMAESDAVIVAIDKRISALQAPR